MKKMSATFISSLLIKKQNANIQNYMYGNMNLKGKQCNYR